jgi:hypothetical protein
MVKKLKSQLKTINTMFQLDKYKNSIDDKGLFIEDVYMNFGLQDSQFKDFCKNNGGGFYCNQSLQMYSVNSGNTYNDMPFINEQIHKLYGNIVQKMIFFGQDIFGNQFAFRNSEVIFFNIETGEIETIAEDFIHFINIILEDIDYYSGESIILEWKAQNVIQLNERLCPKKPFVVGGEYEVSNLYNIDLFLNFKYNSSIANQIRNLPDGTPIKFNIQGI